MSSHLVGKYTKPSKRYYPIDASNWFHGPFSRLKLTFQEIVHPCWYTISSYSSITSDTKNPFVCKKVSLLKERATERIVLFARSLGLFCTLTWIKYNSHRTSLMHLTDQHHIDVIYLEKLTTSSLAVLQSWIVPLNSDQIFIFIFSHSRNSSTIYQCFF